MTTKNVDSGKVKACMKKAKLVHLCGVWETVGSTSTFTRWRKPGQVKLVILHAAGFKISQQGRIEEAPVEARVRRYGPERETNAPMMKGDAIWF